MTPSTSPSISVHPIRNEEDFNRAITRLHQLAMAGFDENSPEDAEYDILQTLADAYQQAHHPVLPPHPLEAIKFMMEQKGLSESALSEVLGGRSRKSEILTGKRKLSLEMIRRLSAFLGISSDVLVRAY